MRHWLLTVLWLAFACEGVAQNATKAKDAAKGLIGEVDSTLAARYYRNKGNIDTAYVVRPQTKWTIMGRLNVSGSNIKTDGKRDGVPFTSEMKAERKATLSLGVSYLGLSLSASLNPAKLAGKYSDYELNFTSYGKRFGFDIAYQAAKNFTGSYSVDGGERVELPTDILSLKTLNVNAFYVFNSRKFSYPAAFSQSYIQRRSAGSFLVTLSAQGQLAESTGIYAMKLKAGNIGVGAGYGYNFVPGRGWLLHLSALPTFIVYSYAELSYYDTSVRMKYHFPEAIITGRGAAVYEWKNMFLSLTMIFNFTGIGSAETMSVQNTRWRVRATYGLRLGKRK